MSKPQCWQEVPLGTVAFGASALKVQTGLWRSMRPIIDADKCVSCLKCWIQCPDDSVELNADNRVCGINLFSARAAASARSSAPPRRSRCVPRPRLPERRSPRERTRERWAPMSSKMKVMTSGNLAFAEAMRQINPDVVAAYPITPSTEIPMRFADLSPTARSIRSMSPSRANIPPSRPASAPRSPAGA